MNLNWHCVIFVVKVYLASGVQHPHIKVSTGPPCACPYSCITTIECAGRHAPNRGIQEVLFNCEDKGKVCCPPLKSFYPDSGSRREILNPNLYKDCPEKVQINKNRFDNKVTGYQVKNRTEYKPTQTPKKQQYYLVPSGFYVHVDNNYASQPPNDSTRSHNSTTLTEPPPPLPSPIPPPPPPPPPLHHHPQNPKRSKIALSSHRNFHLLPSESNCGVNNFANRITEGEEVTLGEYPWMVLTGVKDKYGNYRWNCGGTLINGWYVLTAAHCLSVDNRTIEYVRLGEHSLTNETDCFRDICLEPPEDISIAEVIPHEKWNTTTIKNDIALLRLSRNPLTLGKSNIYPICLPLDMEKLNLTSTSKYEVAGWGKTDWNADEGSNVLRKASISGVSREECNICKDKKKQQYCPISETQLCVQGWKAVDVCKGDSGGPLMVSRLNIYQIGITSFKGSEYCGAENIPSIFTRIEGYLPWILDNIRR